MGSACRFLRRGPGLRHVAVRGDRRRSSAKATASKSPRRSERSTIPACWPITANISSRSSRSPWPSALLHYGRYGSGANDGRLYPMYLGYGTMIRGYEYNSFEAEEADAATGSFDYNRLFGTRVAVANAELRFPLFGALGLGKGYYGIFPVGFLRLLRRRRRLGSTATKPRSWAGIASCCPAIGVGLRANIFGYMVAGRPLRQASRPAEPGLAFCLHLLAGILT